MAGSDTTGLKYDPSSGQWGTYHTEGRGENDLRAVFDPAATQPKMVEGFDPVAMGLGATGIGGGPSGGEGGVEPFQQTEWVRNDPADSNMLQHWDMAGNYLGSNVKKSSWVNARDTAVIPIGKMVLMAAAPYLAPYMPAAAMGLEAGGMAAAAVNGATMGGLTAGVTGGNIGQGMLTGGLGGVAFNAAGQYMAPTQTGDMGQWYDGYSGPASDAGYLTSTAGDAAQWYDGYTGPASDLGYMPDPYTHADLPGFTVGDPAKIDFNIGEPTGALTQTDGLSDTVDNVNQGYGANNSNAADTNAGRSVDGLSEGRMDRGTRDGDPKGGTGSNTSDAFPDGTPSVDVQKSVWDKLGDKAKETFTKPDGSIDWSKALAAAGLVTSVIGNLTAADPPGVTPLSTLVERVKPKDFDTPLPGGGALTSAAPWNTRARTYAADMPSPIVAGTRGYAEGGEVEGALSVAPPFVGFVQGEGGGQDDLIDASLSAGEYVFDAESVSMLGDGNNAEGAKKLDELRASLRAHKRSAPDDQIAPPAQGALSYMNGGQ